MGIPGAAGHQQGGFVLQLAQGAGHVEGVGHHDEAALVAQHGDHGAGGAAAVDDDAIVITDPFSGRTGDRQLSFRNLLGIALHHHLGGQGNGTAVTAQQQATGLQHRQIFADGHFRGGEVFGQGIDAHFTLLLHQAHYGVTALLSITFGHL